MLAHSVLREKPILSIETAVVLFCWPIPTLDLLYNWGSYLASVL